MMRKRLVSACSVFTGLALGSALLASCSSTSDDAPVESGGSAGVLAGGSSAGGTAGHSDPSAQGGGGTAQGGGGGDAEGGSDAQGGNDESSAAAAGMTDAGGSDATGGAGPAGNGGVSGSASGGLSGSASGGLSSSAGGSPSGGASGSASGGVSGSAGGGGNNPVPVCGNGAIESGEQCDDGNQANLDGCDAVCRYEVVDRLTALTLQGTSAPAFCTPTTNRLGAQAFSGTFLSALGSQIQTAIAQATTNMMLQLIDLDDLTGASDAGELSLGFFTAALDPAKGAWPAPGTQDFWFRAHAGELNGAGLPNDSLTASLLAHSLSAGPGLVHLPLSASGILTLRNTRIKATLNEVPAANVPPAPPQLAAGLNVFQTLTASGTGQGMCGNVTVDSLAHIPVPPDLASGGASACGACTGSHAYTACTSDAVDANCNSLLDVLVGGCKAIACFVPAVNAQQPDAAGSDNDLDALSLDAKNKVPSAQSDGNDDAYSSYFKFNANRARVTGKY